MSILVNRAFNVKGRISCLYQPGATASTVYRSGIKVELWQKSPLDVILLGEGLTDTSGYFDISFDATSPNIIIENGKIKEVFVKAYYGPNLIIGDNPY